MSSLRVSTWDGELGQTGPHLGPVQTCRTLCYSCWILMHHMLPSHSMGTLCPQLKAGPGPIHLYPSLSASSSAVSRCANCVAEVKPKLRIPTNDRCCGQRCVQFSSLVSGALSPCAPALHIIEFS